MVMFGLLLIIVCICSALLRWNQMRYSKKGLPPGTMGWPVFGETTEFLKQGPDFMKNQRLRYKEVFPEKNSPYYNLKKIILSILF